jgi:hypothetical protein
MVVVNLAGIKTTLELLPDGTFPARLTKSTAGKSKANNNKISLEFTFEPEAGEEIGGRKAYVEVALTDNALWKVKRTLIDLGYDPDLLEGPVNVKEAFETLLGADAVIRVGHHEYQNNIHNDFYVISPDSWTA